VEDGPPIDAYKQARSGAGYGHSRVSTSLGMFQGVLRHVIPINFVWAPGQKTFSVYQLSDVCTTTAL
jgi:hypothetical protein